MTAKRKAASASPASLATPPPAKPKPKPKSGATTPPPSFATFPRLSKSKRFPSIADQAIVLRQLILVGDAAKEALRRLAEDELEPELVAGGVKENTTIDYHGVKLRIADEGSGSRIDPTALVRLGVSKALVEQATIENKRKHYLAIDLPLDKVNEALRTAGFEEKEMKGKKRSQNGGGLDR